MKPLVVYYSSKSGNTERFMERLGLPCERILPDKELIVSQPFVLITPTYADCRGNGSVDKNVIKFLNKKENRDNILGVIGTGNINFGTMYGNAADVVSDKCKVPVLYKFELSGTDEDVHNVYEGLIKFFNNL